jgi:hypothetical protein
MQTTEVLTQDHEVWLRRGPIHERHGQIRTDEAGQPRFYRDLLPRHVLPKWDAIAIHDTLLDYLEALGVDELHYVIKGEDQTYVTTPAVVREKSIRRVLGIPPRAQHFLPRTQWDLIPGRYPWRNLSSVQVTIEDDDAGS